MSEKVVCTECHAINPSFAQKCHNCNNHSFGWWLSAKPKLMIPDDDLEKLAGKYVKNPIPNNIDSECETDVAKHDFIAGFRAAEKMINDRWPSEDEEIEALAPELVGMEKLSARLMGIGWRLCSIWLKQKMLSAK
jgi:hypothetical protein